MLSASALAAHEPGEISDDRRADLFRRQRRHVSEPGIAGRALLALVGLRAGLLSLRLLQRLLVIYPEKYHCDNCGGEQDADLLAPGWLTVHFHAPGWDRHYCSKRCAVEILSAGL